MKKAPSQLEGSESSLFRAGKRLYSAGLYSVALDSFQSLATNYPLSPYAEFAEIKIADSQFEDRKFEVAASAYEDFAKNHPGSKATPYVLMRAARSYQLSQRGLGRDVSPLNKAIENFDRLLQQYPNSIYAAPAAEFKREALESLAAYDSLVAKFYRHHEKESAATVRAKIVAEKWEPLVRAASDEAAKRRERAHSSTVTFGATSSTPGTPQLVHIARGSGAALGAQESAASARRLGAEDDVAVDTPYRIERIQCSATTGGSTVALLLNKPFLNPEFLQQHGKIESSAGLITLTLPDTSSRAETIDCVQSQDLQLGSRGNITVKWGGAGYLFATSTPPRLLLVLK